MLYLPKEDGGLALPALSTLYKQQQASRHVVFSTSRDSCVRFLESNQTKVPSKAKFMPSVVVSSIQSDNIASTRRQLKAKVQQHILDGDSITRRTHLHGLQVQGRVFRKGTEFSYWAEVVSSLPDREMRFAYNAAIDTLPSNANLALWYRGQVSAQCKLCGYPSQSLKHVLNKCEESLQQRRFDKRHDSVLFLINSFISHHLSDSHVLADLPGTSYAFPSHIASTDERPDIVIWSDIRHTVALFELTIPFEDNFAHAERRKSKRYEGLKQLCSRNGYQAQLLTIQVGSRGVLDLGSLSNLKALCNPKQKVWNAFLVSLSKAAISGSFVIWCSRNSK